MFHSKNNNTRNETTFKTLDNQRHININQNKKWSLLKTPKYKKATTKQQLHNHLKYY